MPLTELLVGDRQLGEQRNVNPVVCSSARSRTLPMCVISLMCEDEVWDHAFSSMREVAERFNARPPQRSQEVCSLVSAWDHHLQDFRCFQLYLFAHRKSLTSFFLHKANCCYKAVRTRLAIIVASPKPQLGNLRWCILPQVSRFPTLAPQYPCFRLAGILLYK